jgi:hypothetical protein
MTTAKDVLSHSWESSCRSAFNCRLNWDEVAAFGGPQRFMDMGLLNTIALVCVSGHLPTYRYKSAPR